MRSFALYPKAAILAEFDRNPKAAKKFAEVLARQVMTLRTRLEQRNIRAARDRVRHYLAVNADADGRTVTLSGTLKDVAGELGLTHEALVPHARGHGGGWRDHPAPRSDPSAEIHPMIVIISAGARMV